MGKNNWRQIITFMGAVLAYMMGSGFATGQELLQYYVSYGYQGILVGITLAAILIFANWGFAKTGHQEGFKMCIRDSLHIVNIISYFLVSDQTIRKKSIISGPRTILFTLDVSCYRSVIFIYAILEDKGVCYSHEQISHQYRLDSGKHLYNMPVICGTTIPVVLYPLPYLWRLLCF